MSEEIQAIFSHFSRADRVAEYFGRPDPMNEARRDMVKRMVLENVEVGSRILEIGCGIGTLITELAEAGMSCTGIDLSAEMVAHARKLIGSSARIEQGDLFNYRPSCRFAAVIANGVIPYYREKTQVLRRIAEFADESGVVVVTHRNALFNLFALNRGTIAFIVQDLLGEMPQGARERLIAGLEAITGLTEPEQRSSSSELYRSAENPLSISDLYSGAGLVTRELRYCFLHGSPPRLGPIVGVPNAAELQRRYELRWEGMFLGSQFGVLAKHCE
jgi:2-polyprenyl-3-methyl-5-hydroxy-6-metoxy-1,4-benzoquinol methylase